METILFLALCILACWVGSKLPGPTDPTAAQIARVIRDVMRRI